MADAARSLLGGGAVDRLLTVAERLPWQRNRLVALTYHRVAEVPGDGATPDGRYPGLVSATPDEFEQHVRVLADRCTPVSIEDVVAAVDGERELPSRAVLLTFDDAVEDFATNALPVLRRFHVPAVVFVPTAYVDGDDAYFWWDALHAAVATSQHTGTVITELGEVRLDDQVERQRTYRRLRDHCLELSEAEAMEVAGALCRDLGVTPPPASVMDWDTLRRLDAAGIRSCPHTRTHPHLDHLSADEVRGEIEGSLEDIRREVGAVVPAFAYPAGRLTPEVTRIAADTGVRAAFTTRRGSNIIGRSDPMTLRRVNVSRRFGLGMVRLQLLPLVDPLSGR